MGGLLTILAPILGDVVKKVIPDKARHAEIEREVKLALLDSSNTLEEQAGKIILAEAKSEHWITASWRPLLMLVIIAIVAMNYLMFPILNMILQPEVELMLELPDQLWNLLQIGVGGYVVGRSGEKIVHKWTNNSNNK